MTSEVQLLLERGEENKKNQAFYLGQPASAAVLRCPTTPNRPACPHSPGSAVRPLSPARSHFSFLATVGFLPWANPAGARVLPGSLGGFNYTRAAFLI